MLDMYKATIPPLKRALKNLASNLKKGAVYAKDKNIEPNVLINARLFPDMYPLNRQVQIATDMSKGAAARLSGTPIPQYEDIETTFDELQARIAKTIDFLDSISPDKFEGAETRDITLKIRNSELKFTGQEYLLRWVNPNVYFHATTAYNIMRHNGVELGKLDFLGPREKG